MGKSRRSQYNRKRNAIHYFTTRRDATFVAKKEMNQKARDENSNACHLDVGRLKIKKRLLLICAMAALIGCGEKKKEQLQTAKASHEAIVAQESVAATPESIVGTFLINENSDWIGSTWNKFVLQKNGLIRTPDFDGAAFEWYINSAGHVCAKDYPDLIFAVTPKGHLRMFGSWGDVEYRRAPEPNSTASEATTNLISNPIIEIAIREGLEKFEDELTEADLRQVNNLTIDDNKFTAIPQDLEKLTLLEELRIDHNQLTDLKGLEKLTKLKKLGLNDNQLSDLKLLENFTQLERLNVSNNRLTDVKGLEKQTELTYLNLGNNNLTDVKGIETLTQLTTLSLSSNNLTSAKSLEGHTRLTILFIDNNQLTDTKGLEKLSQLEKLHLGGNRLTDIKDLKILAKLKKLNLKDNPDLTKTQIAELQKALTNCKIDSNPQR